MGDHGVPETSETSETNYGSPSTPTGTGRVITGRPE